MPQGDPWAGFDALAPKADPWSGFDELAPVATEEPAQQQGPIDLNGFAPMFQSETGATGGPTGQAAATPPPSGQGLGDFAIQGVEDALRGAEIQGGRMLKFAGQTYAKARNAVFQGEQTRAEMGRNVERAGKAGEALTAQGLTHPEPTSFPGRALQGIGSVLPIAAGGPAGIAVAAGSGVEDRYDQILKATGSEFAATEAALAEVPIQVLQMLPVARLFMGGSEGATLARKVLGGIRDAAIGPGAARVVGTVVGEQITKQDKADLAAALKQGIGEATQEFPLNATVFAFLNAMAGTGIESKPPSVQPVSPEGSANAGVVKPEGVADHAEGHARGAHPTGNGDVPAGKSASEMSLHDKAVLLDRAALQAKNAIAIGGEGAGANVAPVAGPATEGSPADALTSDKITGAPGTLEGRQGLTPNETALGAEGEPTSSASATLPNSPIEATPTEPAAAPAEEGFPWETKAKEAPHEATGGIRPLTRAEERDPLSRKDVRDTVLGLANQAQTMELPGQGRVPGGGSEGFAQKGRTQGANAAEWWDRRPEGNKLSPEEIQSTAQKVWTNPKAKLGVREREMIDFLTSEAVREIPTREQAKEAKASLLSKRAQQLAEAEPGSRGALVLGKKEPPATDVREGGLKTVDEYLAARQLREQTLDARGVVYGQDIRAATKGRAEAKLADEATGFYVALKEKGEKAYDSFADKIPEDERAAYEYAKIAPEGVRKVWDQMLADKEASGAEGEARIPEFKARENYAMQSWKPLEEGGSSGTARPKFGLSTPREEARSFPTILEGLAAGREREIKSGLTAYVRSGKQLGLAIENRALEDTLKKSGEASNSMQPGMKRVEAGKLFDSAEYMTPEGEAVKVTLPLFAKEKVADALNKILGESKLKGIGPIETAKRLNNGYRASIFYTGFFHPVQFIRREILSTPGTFKNPIRTYRDGLEAIRQWDPMTQQLAKYSRFFNPQDFTPVEKGEAGRIQKALESIPGADSAKQAVADFGAGMRRFTFERLGAAYKLMGERAELAAWATRNAKWLREGRVTMDDGARAVASAYGDLFGGQNWERILLDEKGLTSKLADPTMRDVTGLMLNTPDWTVSKLRLFVKAFENGEGANVRARMWGRTISRAAAATVAANFIMSLFDDQNLEDRYKEAWSRGWLKVADVDWTPLHNAIFGEDAEKPNARHYFGVVGALADPVSWLFQQGKEGTTFDPIKGTLKHMRYRESFIAKLADNAALAEDSLGRAFTGAGELTGMGERPVYKSKGLGHAKGEEKPSIAGEFNSYHSKYQDVAGPIGYDQMPSYVLGEAMGAMPVQIQAAYAKALGQLDWASFIGRTVGLDLSSPKAPEESKPPKLKLQGGRGMPRR